MNNKALLLKKLLMMLQACEMSLHRKLIFYLSFFYVFGEKGFVSVVAPVLLIVHL